VKWLLNILPTIVVFILLIAAAEAYIRWRHIPQYLLPTPSAVAQAVVDNRAELASALWQTTRAALLGFGASAIFGIGIAIVLASSRVVGRAFYPYTIFFQTVPVVAIAPMLVFWFDPGLKSVAVCAFMVSAFPVITNTLAGLMSTEPALTDLFRLYRSGPMARLIKLRLPWALPNILTGLRISAGLAVIGAVVGEFAAADLNQQGLGPKIQAWAKNGDTAEVFAAIVIASLLGLLMLSIINLLGYPLLRHWHASAKQ